MEALEGRNRPHALRQISNSSSNPESARSRFSDSASSQMSTEDSNEDRDPLLSCTTRNTFDISRCGSCDHRSGTSASTGHARLCEMVAIDSSSESDHSRLLKSSDTSMTSNISFGQVANSYFTQRPGTINPIIPTSSHPYTICRDDTEDMSTAMETMNLQSIQSPSPQTRLSAQNRIRTLELALKREQDENRRLKLRLRETSSS